VIVYPYSMVWNKISPRLGSIILAKFVKMI